VVKNEAWRQCTKVATGKRKESKGRIVSKFDVNVGSEGPRGRRRETTALRALLYLGAEAPTPLKAEERLRLCREEPRIVS
jgi:hypothetical protein